MKTKSSFLTFASLIFLVLVIIWAAIQSMMIFHPGSEKIVPQVASTQEEGQGSHQDYNFGESSSGSDKILPAITIIKPQKKEHKDIPSANEDDKKRLGESKKARIASSLPTRNSAALEDGDDKQNNESAAGITKIEKYPSKEKIEEMNSKGIIIF